LVALQVAMGRERPGRFGAIDGEERTFIDRGDRAAACDTGCAKTSCLM
jgi:hypothetical protein